MISSDSCSQLVAGNYDVIVNEPTSFKSILTDYLERFEQHEIELGQQPPECSYASEFKLLKEFSRTLKEDKANLEDGEQEFNLRKNRYKDIIPFNHTRVILNSDPQIPGSGYINANYIRGPSGSPKAYIACQGPLPCTLLDFWRMIWECGVSVIIMACNEIESGKPKCELYWPDQVDASQCYGNIQVTLVKVRQICSDFLIRKFSVKLLQQSPPPPPPPAEAQQQQNVDQVVTSTILNDETCVNNNSASNNNNNIYISDNNNYKQHKTEEAYHQQNKISDEHLQQRAQQRLPDNNQHQVILERTICQFHYTTWPDHGVPDSVQPILELVRLVRDVQPAEDKPILVHCSAGCGRTGTICCIDFVWGLLRRGKLDSSFDLCNIISEMRQQRMAMVQTLEQYILCHRAVAALFINQLKLIDDHTYENLDSNEDVDEQEDLGPVFI